MCTQYLLRLNNCGLGHTAPLAVLVPYSLLHYFCHFFVYLVHVFIEFDCLLKLSMLPKCVTDRIASAQCPSSYQMSAESVERSVQVDMKHQIRRAGVHGTTSLLCRMCRSLQVMETSGFTGAVEQRDLCCHRDNHCMYHAGNTFRVIS